MSNEQIIGILRAYMKEYELSWKMHNCLSWVIGKLLKEQESDNEAGT